MGWAQNFNDMVAGMSELSLPLVNVEVDIGLVNSENFVLGIITVSEYKDSTVQTDTYNCQVKYRGMLALVLPKKSFTIKLCDKCIDSFFIFSSLQSLSHVRLFATP